MQRAERVRHWSGVLDGPGWPSTAAQFGVFAFLSLVTRAVTLGLPVVDVDEASYLVGARDLLFHHGSLYVTFADHKPPLVYVYYALCLMFGDTMHAVRWMTTIVWLPLTALALSAFFGRGRRGCAAGVLWTVCSAAFLAHDMLAVNCEQLMMLPLAWALVVARGPDVQPGRPYRMGLAGLLAGVAVLFKYQAVVLVPALAIDAVASRGRAAWPGLLALLAGTVVPVAVTYAVFLATGTQQEAAYWNVWHNLLYASTPFHLASATGRMARQLLPFLLTVSPLAYAWWLGRHLANRQVLLLALTTLMFAMSFLGWRFYPHYFVPLYVPLALGAAPWVEASWAAGSPGGKKFAATIAGFVIVATVVNAALYRPSSRVYAETRPVYERVAERLRRDACYPGATMFVWGYAPIFYAASGLPQATRFVFIDSTLVGHRSARSAPEPSLIRSDHWDLLMNDLQRRQPAYVLDTAKAGLFRWRFSVDGFPRLAAWLTREYEPIDTIDEVRILRRRSCLAQPPG